MKLILKNCRQIFQKFYLNSINKNYTTASSVNITSFANIRSVTSVDVRITIYDAATLIGRTMPFRLASGHTSPVSDVELYVGGDHNVVFNNGSVLEFSLSALDFSNITTYPDNYSLKADIRTSTYEDGVAAREVLYIIEYHLS